MEKSVKVQRRKDKARTMEERVEFEGGRYRKLRLGRRGMESCRDMVWRNLNPLKGRKRSQGAGSAAKAKRNLRRRFRGGWLGRSSLPLGKLVVGQLYRDRHRSSSHACST